MQIQSVVRAAQILSLFSHSRSLLGVSEISRLMELPKGTVHGLVSTLASQRFLQQDTNSKKYQLGLKIYELGIILSGTMEINQKAAVPAHQLARRTHLMVRVAIWDSDAAVVTFVAHPRRHAALPHQIGPRAHAYCTGFGKAVLAYLEESKLKAYLDRIKLVPITADTISGKKRLLADLKETRQRGYAIDREEAQPGIGCLGAPLFQRGGLLAGSMSLSGPFNRVLGERKQEYVEDLLNTAREISQTLGHFPSTIDTELPLF